MRISIDLLSRMTNTGPIKNVLVTAVYEHPLKQIEASSVTFNFHNITQRNAIHQIVDGNKTSIYVIWFPSNTQVFCKIAAPIISDNSQENIE